MSSLNLNTLPEGIVDDILEAVQLFDAHTTRRTLCSLCLVAPNFLPSARRELYRRINVEHSTGRPLVESLRRTIKSDIDTAGLIRYLAIGTALGGTARSQASHKLAALLYDILGNCPRLEEIRYAPDENARTFEAAYIKAWNASSSLKRFTLVMSQFREIALLPRQPLQTLTLELAREGDWTWEYDYYTKSWPNRPPLQVEELHLVKLQFPAYNDQVLVGKLEQITRAISCPKTLSLSSCTFSHKALEVLFGLSPNGWRADRLESIRSQAVLIVNEQDKATAAYQLPYLPGLTSLRAEKQTARFLLDPRNEEAVTAKA